uniref:DUF3592 domain-containing protein n=1 Tax=Herbidospora sakaeratensis TaxID=564415 RepID=UPI0007843B79|nr:DUF3592 domain-containing protein [Herbidospora sakaeratensis]
MIGEFIRGQVLRWLGVAALVLGVAAFAYSEETAFARRSVVTSGTVEEVRRSGVLYTDDGSSQVEYHGRVRYTAKGAEVVSNRMRLAGCDVPVCPAPKEGQIVYVAYDSENFNRAVRTSAAGLPHWPVPSPLVWVLGLIGLVPLIGAVVNLMWIWPALRTKS